MSLPSLVHYNRRPATWSEPQSHHADKPTGNILRSRSLRYVAAGYDYGTSQARQFWRRLSGTGRRRIGWAESLQDIALSSWVNVLFVMIPIAWASYWTHWNETATFVLCLVALIPLKCMFRWGGEQMLLYLGTAFGDLLMVTLHNAVEVSVAIVLLMRCELRLLQSVVVGVIVIHLLLIPGTAFLTGGSDIRHQTLHPHHANLNHSLLLIGVLAILLPTALFSALDQGADTGAKEGATQTTASELVSDTTTAILQISRGIAIILLVVYVTSRFYLHDPPSGNNTLMTPQEAHLAIKHEEALLLAEEPKTNVWACMLMLLGTVAMMAVTADFLVDSIQYVREEGGIPEEWFGLVFLPNLSKLSADVVVAIIFFIKSIYHKLAGNRTQTPSILARGRAIDLSIQFTLWWMPFLVLLGWWTVRPMHLLFDYFKVTLLLGTCLLVNYITADAQTNWVEGLILIAFYVMIAVTAWFYPGYSDVHFQLTLLCPASVTEAIAHGGDAGAEILRRALRAA